MITCSQGLDLDMGAHPRRGSIRLNQEPSRAACGRIYTAVLVPDLYEIERNA
jgi:hypothetical protein